MRSILVAYDVVIIGGGIIGVSTAWQLQQIYPEAKILLLEKEDALACHQTGRNSGVIHAGVYYPPGSLKADFCRRGAAQIMAFCREHQLPFLRCGKLLVATDEVEFERMAQLENRCGKNSIDTVRLSGAALRKEEPRIRGVGALLVPATGITDYRRITSKMAELFIALGGQVRLGQRVMGLREHRDAVEVRFGTDKIKTKFLIACGGLLADRLAGAMGIDIDFQIIPFRGEYYRLPAWHRHIVKHLIYPIPDPALPFLGVHLTPMVDGAVTVGPNAVLGWKREGYSRFNFNPGDAMEMLAFSGFWKVMRENLIAGAWEIKNSFHKRGYLKRVRRYCPSLTAADLKPYPTGIRAQAVKKDGTLVHDFLFAETERSLHVCNAPSPAATSAVPIGGYICRKVRRRFKDVF